MTLIHPYDALVRMILLSIPLVVGGILHMVAVKTNILSYFKKPIHHRWFGQNKTWRGFIIMPLATFPGVLLAQLIESSLDLSSPLLTPHSSWALALLLGLAYCIAELPNSFVKRRVGIKEGETSEKFKVLFVLTDQADSVLGCLLAYLVFLQLNATIFIGTLVLGTMIHLAFNILLYAARLRKNPF